MVQGRIQGLAKAHLAGQGHHHQGTQKAHAKHRDHQAPGEEKLLLAGGHAIQHPGIHDRVVEGEGDLQQQQHQGQPCSFKSLEPPHRGQAHG